MFLSFAYLAYILPLITASPFHHAQVISNTTALLPEYDFIVIGGGTSGLTVADRLTENANTTVLVIEYGPLDHGEDAVLVPGLLNLTSEPYWFDVFSTPQRHLNNGTFRVPVAAVVGGASVFNGMFFDRGSAADYNLWEELGNPGWGWDDLLPYFKKSENFSAPSKDFANQWPEIRWDEDVHGHSGPVQSSYPVYQFPVIKNYFEAFHSLGITTPADPASGTALGVFWGPSSLDPTNETRSYARTAHYNGVAWRSNYHLLPMTAASKIVFDENKTAMGVQYISRITNKTSGARVRKEVILAAGAIRSPQILQVSGVGSKAVTDVLGVQSVVDLPGVGVNLQDHPTIYLAHNFGDPVSPNVEELTTNNTYAAEQSSLYFSDHEGAYTITAQGGNTVAFLPLGAIVANISEIISLANSKDPSIAYTSSSTNNTPLLDPELLAGYTKQRKLLLAHYASNTSAVQESGFAGSTVPITLLRPLSRGTVVATSLSPSDAPSVDYGTLNDDTDLATLIAILRFNRRVMAGPSLAKLQPTEISPGSEYVTDEDLETVLRRLIQPTYQHPCCTCAMLPRELGGVVDHGLRVYGVKGLSVVDAGIMPVIPGTHTSATVYATAEKAAHILKSRHGIA